MAEDTMTTNAGNDSTNVPQPATEPANIPADAAETMLGGSGTTNGTTNGTTTEQAPAGAPEAYDFRATIPEGVDMDETITREFSDLSRSMNLTNEQANQMAAYGIKYGQQIADAVKAQYNAEVQRWGEQAKAELGANLDKTLATAGAGIEAIERVVPGIRQALNETGAGNRIEVIRAMEMLGQLVQADPGKMINAGGTSAPAPAQTWYPNSKM